jgi:hypothetical protein
MPAPGPGSSPVMLVASDQGVPPSPVMVTTIRTGTECGPAAPGPGFVQVTLLCHVAVVPLMLLKASATRLPLRLARGSAEALGPQ